MKRIAIVCSLMLLTAGVAFAQEEVDVQEPADAAQTQDVSAAPKAKKERKMFLSLGYLHRVMGENMPGGALACGAYTSPNSLITAEINAGMFNAGKIASYSYGYFPTYDQYTDGKITYAYTAVEFLISWYYVKSLSDKFQLRAGPSFGILSISGEESYDPTEKNGSKIHGIPSPTTETKSTVAGGLGLGIMWNMGERWFLDLGYRLLLNPGLTFDERTIRILGSSVKVNKQEFSAVENQFGLSIGFRI